MGIGSSLECICINVGLWICLSTAQILVLNKGDLRSRASFLGSGSQARVLSVVINFEELEPEKSQCGRAL